MNFIKSNLPKVNFIKHYIGFMDRMADDTRLTPHHVSLYITLFQYWNLNHFRNPVSISREEVMLISKIGSVNTYVKCLKDLDAWHYIKYMPSFNPQRGSKVHLYRFDKGSDKADGKADNKTGEQPVRPSINRSNSSNNESREKDIPPAQDSVFEFFNSKNAGQVEAEKFFAHYKANGWRLSGRTPMQDWQAAATKWILNINSFNAERSRSTTQDQNHERSKDYSEPL